MTNPRVIPAAVPLQTAMRRSLNPPEEDRREEERPDVGEDDHQLGHYRGGEPRVGEQLYVEGYRQSTLAAQEHHEEQYAGNQRGVGRPVPDSGMCEFGDAVDGAEDPAVEYATEIGSRGCFVSLRASGRAPRTGSDDQGHHRKIHQKHGAPIEMLKGARRPPSGPMLPRRRRSRSKFQRRGFADGRR